MCRISWASWASPAGSRRRRSRCGWASRADGSRAGDRSPARVDDPRTMRSFRIFRLAGIDVGVHPSWLLIFGLVTWSLATGYFPLAVPDLDATSHWILGIAAALLLFASVLVHELAHSLVAKAQGLEATSITLFIFGGVSNLSSESQRPRVEFVVAIVGPLSSFAIAGLAWVG